MTLAFGTFVLEQVVLEGVTTHNFATACCSEALRRRLTSFQFWHGLTLIRHNLQSYHDWVIQAKLSLYTPGIHPETVQSRLFFSELT